MSNLAQYLPNIYEGVLETDTLMDVEDDLFGKLNTQCIKGQANQYILTADETGIKLFEDMAGIVADPATENIEFRRQRLINRFSTAPPFTFKFLKTRLDAIIGKGAWKAYIDYDNYTLYVESSAENQLWYHELLITITSIKPANIVFISKPFISTSILANETISYGLVDYNYKLGTTWVLGQKPFANFEDKGVIKMPGTASIEDALLSDLAASTASSITSVRINGTYVINSFTLKSATNNVVTIEYSVLTSSGLTQIDKVELLGANSEVLSTSLIYVPLIESVVLKHTIVVEEG